jgi:hypothetical protein
MMCRLSPEVKAINCGVIRDWAFRRIVSANFGSLCPLLARLRHADGPSECLLMGTTGSERRVVKVTLLDPQRTFASAKSEKEPGQVGAARYTSSINNASIPDLRNVTIASVGVQTIGSLSLKEVLTTSGTPVCAKKQDMSS